MWVLNLNMGGGVAGYKKNSFCPGISLVSASETFPYAPAGGITYYAAPSDTTKLLVPAGSVVVNSAIAPPPPTLDLPLPPPVTLPAGCMTVEQFLCTYTIGTAINPANVNATSGVSLAGGCVAGVMYFMTTTGNAYIQDPFAPFASIWINDNQWGAGTDTKQGLSVAPSTLADGTPDYYLLGLDGGWGVGQYLVCRSRRLCARRSNLHVFFPLASRVRHTPTHPSRWRRRLAVTRAAIRVRARGQVHQTFISFVSCSDNLGGLGTSVGVFSVSFYGLSFNNQTCECVGPTFTSRQ